ncbi:hypothetical protein CRV01_08560 [Arcobacter sp. CECT 8983]|uniref:hypothetical protein n=1 Tax=Arcobacter sp. CECT 8983 TaxID=2044508 RepID=UPI00100BFE51|nr:hypothetical protein [Arcobacter sp. CECT 8983]RXJ89517.1 hypothetical protein CRV01_08560 [Arcobacter sp. CECT 8983]
MKTITFISLLTILTTFSLAKESKILSSENGRYVLGQISEMRADQYLLDTKNGKVWNIVADKNGNKSLEPIEILDFYYDDKSKKMLPVKLYQPIKN